VDDISVSFDPPAPENVETKPVEVSRPEAGEIVASIVSTTLRHIKGKLWPVTSQFQFLPPTRLPPTNMAI
jgi:hypothetical protein